MSNTAGGPAEPDGYQLLLQVAGRIADIAVGQYATHETVHTPDSDLKWFHQTQTNTKMNR